MRLGHFVFVVLFCFVPFSINAAEKLTVVADEWPPFSGEELPNRGISLDVISNILERAGYEVETEILPWARVMDGARRQEHDIIGSLFFDDAMTEFLTYGEPFFETRVKFVQQVGTSHNVESLDALQPYSIAVGDGFLYEENFDRAENLNKVTVTTALQAIRMVAYGRADLTLDSEEVVNYALQQSDPEIADRVEILPHVLASHAIHMAVRNNHPLKDQILADFNKTLREMRDDGSLAEILQVHVNR